MKLWALYTQGCALQRGIVGLRYGFAKPPGGHYTLFFKEKGGRGSHENPMA
jgi:hypothetical protein